MENRWTSPLVSHAGSTLELHEKPLLTFAVAAYNQERFIEEAVGGALTQTYTPLEIILSDDCSSDATFQIIQRMAASYRGCHRLILNRNEHNLGIGGHINRIFDLAHGFLVVVAAGDDISLPERTQATYEAWEASQKKALYIYSGHSVIGEDGQPLNDTGFERVWSDRGTVTEELCSVREFFSSKKMPILGATSAWSFRIMDVFGPLPDNLVHEDEVLALRATCLGPVMRVALPLVKYRVHNSNIFSSAPKDTVSLKEIDLQEARDKRLLHSRHQMYGAFIRDLETARSNSLISESCYEQAVQECRRQQRLYSNLIEFYTGSFVRKCSLLFRLRKQGLPVETLRRLVHRLLPASSYRVVKSWRKRLQSHLM